MLDEHCLVNHVGECITILQRAQHPEREVRVAECRHDHAPVRQETLPGKSVFLSAPLAGHQDCHLGSSQTLKLQDTVCDRTTDHQDTTSQCPLQLRHGERQHTVIQAVHASHRCIAGQRL